MEKLAIKSNNVCKEETCFICGEITEPDCPIWIFKHDTFDAVCEKCAEKEAPILKTLLDTFYSFYELGNKINRTE